MVIPTVEIDNCSFEYSMPFYEGSSLLHKYLLKTTTIDDIAATSISHGRSALNHLWELDIDPDHRPIYFVDSHKYFPYMVFDAIQKGRVIPGDCKIINFDSHPDNFKSIDYPLRGILNNPNYSDINMSDVYEIVSIDSAPGEIFTILINEGVSEEQDVTWVHPPERFAQCHFDQEGFCDKDSDWNIGHTEFNSDGMRELLQSLEDGTLPSEKFILSIDLDYFAEKDGSLRNYSEEKIDLIVRLMRHAGVVFFCTSPTYGDRFIEQAAAVEIGKKILGRYKEMIK